MLGAREPRWAHAPLVTGPGGERLSKRDAALSLSAMAQRAEDPRRIVAALASISGLPADPAGCLPADLVGTFALDRIPQGPARVAGISIV
jgi:glutamyl/glutaminyl-tRNA synthetase